MDTEPALWKESALWLLMVWCFNTRASAATVLITYCNGSYFSWCIYSTPRQDELSHVDVNKRYDMGYQLQSSYKAGHVVKRTWRVGHKTKYNIYIKDVICTISFL